MTVAAQRHYRPNFAIGGKAGGTLSMMSFSPKVSQSMLPGVMAGVVARYTEEKLFGLIAEFVNLGPEIGYMLGDHISANFNWRDILNVNGYPQGYRTNRQLDMEVENRFDYGISAGLGMELILKRRHSIMLEGRFYYGLGNIFHSAKKDYFSASRGMSVEITAAYLFRLR